LEREVDAWLDGVRRLGEDGLDRPCGPSEGPFADAPLATLVLHIHRELIHHLAEVSPADGPLRARQENDLSM